MSSQNLFTFQVRFSSLVMLPAVELHNERWLETAEINDVSGDRMLAAELVAIEPIPAKEPPNLAFDFALLMAELARAGEKLGLKRSVSLAKLLSHHTTPSRATANASS